MNRAQQDGRRAWGKDIVGTAVVGGVAGCIAGAIPSGGVGCPVGGLVGFAGGAIAGFAWGGIDGGLTAVWGMERAREDYATATQRCSQL